MKKILVIMLMTLPLLSKSVEFTAICTPKAAVNTKSGESYLITPKEAKIKYLKVDKNVIFYDGHVYRNNDKFCLWECKEDVKVDNLHIYKRDKRLFIDELFSDDEYKLLIYKCEVKDLPKVEKKSDKKSSSKVSKSKDSKAPSKKPEDASEETFVGDGKYPIKDETFPPDVAWRSVIDVANPELADKLRAEQTEKELAKKKVEDKPAFKPLPKTEDIESDVMDEKSDEERTIEMIKKNAKNNHDESFFKKIQEMF